MASATNQSQGPEREREEIATHIIQAGQGAAWVGVVALLLHHPKATVEFKKSLTDEWKDLSLASL